MSVTLYCYRAEVIRITDGDTCVLELDQGCHAKILLEGRLKGIDTPEVFGVKKWADKAKTTFTEGYQRGVWASEEAREWFLEHGLHAEGKNVLGKFPTLWVLVRTFKDKKHRDRRGKYGRYLVEVYPYDGSGISLPPSTVSLNQHLVETGNARVANY